MIYKNNILRSLNLIWKTTPFWSVLNALFIILKGTLPLLLIVLIKMLIDKVSFLINNISQIKIDDVLNDVLWFAGALFVLNAVVNSLSNLVNEKQSFYISDLIQNMIHSRTTTFEYSNYEDRNFQNIFYRAISESTFRPKRIFYGFVGLLQNIVTLILIGGILIQLHWLMIIVLFVVSIPIIIIRLNYSKKIYFTKKKYTSTERLVGYYHRLLTGKDFAKEVRMFNLSNLFKKRYEILKDDLRNKQFKLLKFKAGYELVVQLITAVALFLVFGYISYQTVLGSITQGEMVMYFMALYRGYGFLQETLTRISSLYEDGLFLRNFYEFIDYKVQSNPVEKIKPFPKSINKGIIFNNVSFKYPGSSRTVFENVNVKINANETVAIVGENGAGKTTFVKLLCGLYSPDIGNIEIDGVEINTINPDALAKNVSVVFQNFMLYNVSAQENIWFGDVMKGNNIESIERSAKEAGVHNLLKELPNGYNTRLGTLFEDSEMLSVGEWQRVALARSFFNDAQLVILDEPTSSIDAFTEAMLIHNFKNITKDKTSIIVSHRLSTIKLADRIIVLNNHGVEEVGTFDELINRKGHFYEIHQLLKH